MNFKVTRGALRQSILIVMGLPLLVVNATYGADTKSVKASSAQHEARGDAGDWKKIVEAAKKEGKIVMSGDPSEVWRKSLVDMFQEEYPEIKVEFTGGNGRNIWPRIQQERGLGQKLWDLRAGGMEPLAIAARREGFLDPIRPLLLPEIADDSKWIGGMDGLFYDKEKKYIPMYTIYIDPPVAVNRDFIKELELKSSGQLLDPKFRGKIVLQTPTGGASYSSLGNLGVMYGENFLRELMSKQNLVVTDDKRQQAEWLVRGKYPIAVGFNGSQLVPFQKQGLGKNVAMLEDKIIPVGTGGGGIFLLKDAPHPNAARVYINWLLTKQTQTRLIKNVTFNSRRTDVPPVLKELAIDPSRMSSYRFYSREENIEVTERYLPELIKELMRY